MMEYYLAMKGDEILYGITWMNLENMLKEKFLMTGHILNFPIILESSE
jgi:hypothetical protein